MGGENVADLIFISVELQLIIDVQNGPARVAEYGIYPLLQQALH